MTYRVLIAHLGPFRQGDIVPVARLAEAGIDADAQERMGTIERVVPVPEAPARAKHRP